MEDGVTNERGLLWGLGSPRVVYEESFSTENPGSVDHYRVVEVHTKIVTY